MGCGNEISDWDDKAIQDSVTGKNAVIDGQIMGNVISEVQHCIAERSIECLKENADNARNSLQEKIMQEGREPDPMERLDLEVVPTREQCREMFKAAKELGLKDWEVVNDPVIFGTQSVRYVPEKTREVMKILHTSKMSEDLWNVTHIDGIMFVDAKTADEVYRSEKDRLAGYTLKPEHLIENKNLSRIVHVVLDERGELVIRGVPYVPKDKPLDWVLAHEIFHLNHYGPFEMSRTEEIMGVEHDKEWAKACASQREMGPVSEYAQYNDQEFACEHFAAWVTDHPQLCPEMKDFFDKHFSK